MTTTDGVKPAKGAGIRAGWVELDLRKLREGLTAKAAAKAAGVDRRAWQRWEKKGRMPADALAVFSHVTGRKP